MTTYKGVENMNDIKVKDFLNKEELEATRTDLYNDEYEGSLDGGWALENDSQEAKTFLLMSNVEKVEYAKRHAMTFVETEMNEPVEKFVEYWHDRYEIVFDKWNKLQNEKKASMEDGSN